MEQNKVLMVIVSVAIFFAAIIGVGVALLYPRATDAPASAAGSSVREFDPIEYVRNPEDAPLTDEESTDPPTVIVYGDSEETDAAAAEENDGAAEDPVVTDGDAPVTISQRPARDPQRTPAEPAPTEPEPDAPAEAGDQPTAVAEPAPSAGRTEPTPRQIRVTEYWIQLIASPSRDRVEQARTTLSDYSLGGRVTTRDVDGELYYRLRVGPYESHSEAEKFLEWIRDIEGFGGAYISEEYPLRTVRS